MGQADRTSDDGAPAPSSDIRHQIRTFSFGAGVQSTACLVLAAHGKIDFSIFCFANTGDEHPSTYKYLDEVLDPYAKEHGLEIRRLKRTWRDGSQRSIREHIDIIPKSIPIPVYLESGKPWKRSCTASWKIDVLAKHQKEMGATPDNKAVAGLGISLDEIQRARTDSGIKWQTLEYPLLELKMTRRDCEKLTADEGLPPAPRSACFYCPYHSTSYFRTLAEEDPELFAEAVVLEDKLNERSMIGLGSKVRLWRGGPLRTVTDQQELDFGDGDESADSCDTGHCFT